MSEENQENARATITINDIASVVEILRVVTDRGVWRVSELTGVGQLYDRLVAFLEAAGVTVNKPEAQEGSNQE